MANKPKKPFHKILTTRAKLGMFVELGDRALGEQSAQEFAAEVLECFDHLMAFRNIVNGMVSLDEPPARAALAYVSDDDVAAARGD